jgi:outer membrane protein assembly factor BamB
MSKYFSYGLGGACWALFFSILAGTASAETPTAETIYRATGVQGGLVVHLGCGSGELTADLAASDRYLVHGLDSDAANVELARKRLQARKLYGRVSVNRCDGRQLPYLDNLVNLVVASELSDVSPEEIHRVLAPGGVAYVQRDGAWHKTVKPRPAEIDEWSHFLHDASGDATSRDRQVASPNRLRWVAEPRWCRSHEIPSSVNAVVTAGGRIFTIFDEGPTGVYRGLPQRCSLIARDAFNGVLLWSVPMRQWQPEFGTGTGNRWNIHHTIPRRLVASGNRVYVTLGFLDSPVSVLDAATGETLTETLEGTRGTDEMILDDGVLIAKITDGRSVAATERIGRDSLNDVLAAVDVATGKQLWRREDTRVVPYALAAAQGRVVYHDMDALICLDLWTGDEVWRAANEITSTLAAASTLVIRDNVVLFHGQTQPAANDGEAPKKNRVTRYLTACSLEDGRRLWQSQGSGSLAAACTQPTDVFVADGTVWCGNSLQGRDLQTGEVVQSLDLAKLISPGHHYRCHRAKATERFLIWPKRGAEFVDLQEGDHMRNDWLRAPCFTGATPANGLFYVPPSQCFCYPGVKVFGFLALAGDVDTQNIPAAATPRLERGPAFGNVEIPASPSALGEDWPMYRRDGRRSGATAMQVPAQLEPQWQTALTCRGSQPVIVGDRLWVAEKDAHRIRCLDTGSGQDVWSFTAGGRIDSSPTISEGRVVFGCRDGSVYCLRATDGVLVWRFHAAPGAQKTVAFGQLESLWPVQGSVLVQDAVVYFAAGRSSFLDGGITVYGLDIDTGNVLHQHQLDGPWPDIQQDVGEPFAMDGALPDLIVSDAQGDLYMQRIKFDAALNRLPVRQESPLGELDMGADHLVATGGFLDNTGFDRLYWMYSQRWPGFYFAQQSPKAGQLVVFDDSTTYAVKYFYRRIQWSPAFFPGEQGYLLFADDNGNQPILEEKSSDARAIEWLPDEAATDQHRRGGRGVEKGTGYVRQSPAKWQHMVPLRIRAMVLAGDHLFAAGTPDVVDPEDPLAGFEGRGQAVLQVFSAGDGAQVATYPLPAQPAFDGLSAAGGRLYLATHDGQVICLGAPAGT